MNIKKLKKAAQSHGTPLYVYDLSVIDRQLEKLKVAFNKINNYQIHFAAKALSNISILKYINSLGLGLDAVSIEEVKIYKPHPKVYDLPIEKYKIKKNEVVFLSANTWDVSGAGNYGYQSIWVNRNNNIFDNLDYKPNNQIKSLSELINLI